MTLPWRGYLYFMEQGSLDVKPKDIGRNAGRIGSTTIFRLIDDPNSAHHLTNPPGQKRRGDG
jgi:hypothetical protein